MKGILFTPDNIKAIRDLRKDVTRRLDGLKEINQEPDAWGACGDNGEWTYTIDGKYRQFIHTPVLAGFNNLRAPKPRYQVGEVVYIKEAIKWDGEVTLYASDNKPTPPNPSQYFKWNWVRNSLTPLFMPAWAARSFLKILSVRPERLQSITEEDAIREGMSKSLKPISNGWLNPVEQYVKLWDSINPKQKWELNPWCWRIDFKLLDKV